MKYKIFIHRKNIENYSAFQSPYALKDKVL